MASLTRQVGEFVAGMDYRALPAAAGAAAKNGIADLAGVTILGRDMPVVRILKSLATTLRPGGGEARIAFSSEGASAVEAALINGAAGHALDYDDIGIGVHPAHPSVVLAVTWSVARGIPRRYRQQRSVVLPVPLGGTRGIPRGYRGQPRG